MSFLGSAVIYFDCFNRTEGVSTSNENGKFKLAQISRPLGSSTPIHLMPMKCRLIAKFKNLEYDHSLA